MIRSGSSFWLEWPPYPHDKLVVLPEEGQRRLLKPRSFSRQSVCVSTLTCCRYCPTCTAYPQRDCSLGRENGGDCAWALSNLSKVTQGGSDSCSEKRDLGQCLWPES